MVEHTCRDGRTARENWVEESGCPACAETIRVLQTLIERTSDGKPVLIWRGRAETAEATLDRIKRALICAQTLDDAKAALYHLGAA